MKIGLLVPIASAICILTGCAAIANFQCRNKDSEEWDDCMEDRGMLVVDADTKLCREKVSEGVFRDKEDCRWALDNPDEYVCKTESKTEAEYKKCLWRQENPVEAACEAETKDHPGYWECVKIKREHEDREEALAERRRANRQRIEAERQQAFSNALINAAGTFNQQPAVNCTSNQIGSTTYTNCH